MSCRSQAHSRSFLLTVRCLLLSNIYVYVFYIKMYIHTHTYIYGYMDIYITHFYMPAICCFSLICVCACEVVLFFLCCCFVFCFAFFSSLFERFPHGVQGRCTNDANKKKLKKNRVEGLSMCMLEIYMDQCLIYCS